MVHLQWYDRKKINDTLPPYKMVIAPVPLAEDEVWIIEEVMDHIS